MNYLKTVLKPIVLKILVAILSISIMTGVFTSYTSATFVYTVSIASTPIPDAEPCLDGIEDGETEEC
ncbi:MAG: hypothetical protein LUC95_06580 [Lachnospiraceae bacterium]|nr:hypothetical protein [Lachnospiraceae bacterium]